MRKVSDVEENRTWIGECVKRPVTDLDPDTDLVGIGAPDGAAGPPAQSVTTVRATLCSRGD